MRDSPRKVPHATCRRRLRSCDSHRSAVSWLIHKNEGVGTCACPRRFARIEQNNGMLEKEPHAVHGEALLRKQPQSRQHRTAHSNHADTYTREFVWIATRIAVACWDRGNWGTNQVGRGMKRRHCYLRFISVSDIVCRASNFFKMWFEGDFEVRRCPSEERGIRGRPPGSCGILARMTVDSVR
jgi:hypothetical protein